MNHGRAVEVFDRADATKERIMKAAAGTHATTVQLLKNGAAR
jgi:ribose transport system ATP-binding protein